MAALTVVLGLLLAACGGDGADGVAGGATDGDAVATVDAGEIQLGPDGQPQAFVDRDPLPSCGTLETFPPQEDPPLSPEESCFRDAVGGDEGAELVRRARTFEGDLILDYFRALPGGTTVEVFSDSTADEFGPRHWYRRECTGLKERRATLFEFEDCGESQTYLARQLTGRWVDAGTIEFRADGTWSATDACEHGRGTFTVDEVGTFEATVIQRDATSGADCEAADSPLDALETAVRARVTADETLALHRSVRDLELARFSLAD